MTAHPGLGSGALREALGALTGEMDHDTPHDATCVKCRLQALSLSSPIEPPPTTCTRCNGAREALERAANIRYTVKQYVYNQGNDPSGNNQNQKAELREIEKTLPREAQDAIRALAPSRQGAAKRVEG